MLSFVKLDINIFDKGKIKIIRGMPNGEALFVLWIGMICLGMKSNIPGVLQLADGIPHTAETLSMELNIPKPTVELGIVLFKKYKMIDIFRNKTIYLKNFEKHQNLEKINSQKEKNRIKVATHRKKVKQMIGKSVTVTEPLQLGYVTDKTKKTDLDSEKDTDTEFWGSGFLNSTDLKTQDDKYCFTVSYEYYEKKDSNIEIHVRTFRRYIKTLQEYSNFNNAILNYKQEGIKIRYQKNFSDFVKAHKSYIY